MPGSLCFVLHACLSVHASVRPNTQYLGKYETDFRQTYINDALWDRDESFTFGVKKSQVKVTVTVI